MATTSIWAVKGRIEKILRYATNPEKTEEANYAADVESGSLEGVLDYATNPEKTEKQCFVTGINCSSTDAKQEMDRVKRHYKKLGGIVAFHAYQSFKPGETTPDTAHEIGVKLATGLWGDAYQMVVSTHLDKDHIHNHIVINSVSCEDGKRFHRDNKCYYSMRKASDRLCAEYGLSVIDKPKRGQAKHYGEWRADAEGKPTWRSLVKADVDEAIKKAMTDRQFFQNLEAIGYEIKTGKDISVRPPGKERFVRLCRSFGDDYSYDGIARRILENKQPRLPITKQKHVSSLQPKRATLPRGSIIGLYRHYKYLFGYYSRGSPGSNSRMHFLLREDIRKLDEITEELKLLEREIIDSAEQLTSFMDSLDSHMQELDSERCALRKEDRIRRSGAGNVPANPRIAEIGKELKVIRKEVKRCQSIQERSVEIASKVKRLEEASAWKKTKEEPQDGRIGSGGRTTAKNDPFRQ